MLNYYEEEEGSDMYFNFGEKPEIPTISDHMQVTEKNWGVSKGYYISSADVKPGNYIAVTLLIGIESSLRISSQSYKGNRREVLLNDPIFDYLEGNKTKIYEFDFDVIRDRDPKTIYVEVIEYSGNPDMEFSLD